MLGSRFKYKSSRFVGRLNSVRNRGPRGEEDKRGAILLRLYLRVLAWPSPIGLPASGVLAPGHALGLRGHHGLLCVATQVEGESKGPVNDRIRRLAWDAWLLVCAIAVRGCWLLGGALVRAWRLADCRCRSQVSQMKRNKMRGHDEELL